MADDVGGLQGRHQGGVRDRRDRALAAGGRERSARSVAQRTSSSLAARHLSKPAKTPEASRVPQPQLAVNVEYADRYELGLDPRVVVATRAGGEGTQVRWSCRRIPPPPPPPVPGAGVSRLRLTGGETWILGSLPPGRPVGHRRRDGVDALVPHVAVVLLLLPLPCRLTTLLLLAGFGLELPGTGRDLPQPGGELGGVTGGDRGVVAEQPGEVAPEVGPRRGPRTPGTGLASITPAAARTATSAGRPPRSRTGRPRRSHLGHPRVAPSAAVTGFRDGSLVPRRPGRSRASSTSLSPLRPSLAGLGPPWLGSGAAAAVMMFWEIWLSWPRSSSNSVLALSSAALVSGHVDPGTSPPAGRPIRWDSTASCPGVELAIWSVNPPLMIACTCWIEVLACSVERTRDIVTLTRRSGRIDSLVGQDTTRMRWPGA